MDRKFLKPYKFPKMKVVELHRQEALMQYSGNIGFHDSEKEYLA
ncbi:hypothetical protein [Fibrobacter succinogenes]|nr:hypothetical protein [Fibrobacter succinogenes]